MGFNRIFHGIYWDVPSGKHTKNYGESPIYSWVNQLFLWPCSLAFCMFTRGYSKCQKKIETFSILFPGWHWYRLYLPNTSRSPNCLIYYVALTMSMAIEIVDLPSCKLVILHSFLYVYVFNARGSYVQFPLL